MKGKAAIDGVDSRLGKSGGSVVHQGLLMFFSSISMSAPCVAAILMLAIFGWVLGVRSLGKKFSSIIGEKGREEVSETFRSPQRERMVEEEATGLKPVKTS